VVHGTQNNTKITKEKTSERKERIHLKLANFKFIKTFSFDSSTARKVICTFACSKLISIFEIEKKKLWQINYILNSVVVLYIGLQIHLGEKKVKANFFLEMLNLRFGFKNIR
jgi:hypothetical protein